MEILILTHILASFLEVWVVHGDAVPINIKLAILRAVMTEQEFFLAVNSVLTLLCCSAQLDRRRLELLKLAEMIKLCLKFLPAVCLEQSRLDVVVGQLDVFTGEHASVHHTCIHALLQYLRRQFKFIVAFELGLRVMLTTSNRYLSLFFTLLFDDAQGLGSWRLQLHNLNGRPLLFRPNFVIQIRQLHLYFVEVFALLAVIFFSRALIVTAVIFFLEELDGRVRQPIRL